MNKKLILIGLTFLLTALFVGTPFEFLDALADSVVTSVMIVLFLMLFIILVRQIWRLDNQVFKCSAFGLLVILAVPYFFIGIWTMLLTWSNYHPMWQDLFIYTNNKNEKIISQWRETSGSMYDYRDRKMIADYGQCRVSLDCDAKKLQGVWTEYDTRNNKTKTINFDNKK